MPGTAADDAALVERLRAGDEDAFRLLIDRFDAPLRRVARTYVATDAAADEVVQDTWLGVLRGIDRFEQRSSLKTWIFRIALNHCRDRLSRFRPPMQPIAEEPDDDAFTVRLTDPGRDPESLAVAADESRRVSRCLARVPHAFREAVVLRDLEGLSYEEIAEVLGVRMGTVRSRIARGREQLRTLLEGGK